MNDLRAPVPDDPGHAEDSDGLQHWRGDSGHLRGLHPGPEVGLVDSGEPLVLGGFLRKAFHDPDAGQRLLQGRGHVGRPFLAGRRDAAQPVAETDHGIDRQRNHDNREQRQPPVLIEHHAQEHQECQALLEEILEDAGHGVLNPVHVVDDAGHHPAGRILEMEADRELHQVAEELLADVGHDAASDVDHQIGLAITRDPFEHRHGHQRHRQEDQPRRVPVDEDLVESGTHEPGIGARKGSHQP